MKSPQLAALLLCGAAACHAQGAADAQGVTIAFTNATAGASLDDIPHVPVSVSGGPVVAAILDTGSTGLVISADLFPLRDDARSLGAGTRTYSSSGRVEHGVFYAADVTVGSGDHAIRARVPVLRVTSITCLPRARDCTPRGDPKHVALMGIGFGQSSATQADWGPDKNPFLHVVGATGTAKGYVLTNHDVTVGLTARAMAGFDPVRLTWNATYRDWNRPKLTIEAGGVSGAGTVLTDTGLPYMFVRPPPGSHVATTGATPYCRFAPCAGPGERFRIAIGDDPGRPAAAYTVTIGAAGKPEAGPAAPPWVTVLSPRDAAGGFVNTSFHFLNAFDYFYDFSDGTTGYRRRAPP